MKKKKQRKYEENPEPEKEYEKNKYDKDPELKKENRKKMHKKNKNCLNKVKTFCQQIREDPYFIRTVCHWGLSKHSTRLFEHEKYHILTVELYCPLRSFD